MAALCENGAARLGATCSMSPTEERWGAVLVGRDHPGGRLHGLLLLPHERPAAERAWDGYESRPDTRLRQNYGPAGMALLAASRIGTRLAFGTGVVGLLLYAAPVFGVLGLALVALGMALACVGIGRGFQAGAAGRRFRGGRPYVKRPDRPWW